MKKPLLSLLLSLIAFAALAQNSIDWFTIDGGGGTSTNAQYSVSGTIGQPDAERMSGGQYSLTGGFWSLVAAVQTPSAPLLTITPNLQLSMVTLSWPWPSSGFTLQQNSNLANTNGWSAYTGPTSTNGTTRSVTIAPPTGNWYFRLKQ